MKLKICSMFLASEFHAQTFRNTVLRSWRPNCMCRRFRTLCSMFLASEFHVQTFHNTLVYVLGVWISCADVSEHSVLCSWRLNFIFRRFRTLCSMFLASEFHVQTFQNTLFYVLGVWISCADVSEHSVSSIFLLTPPWRWDWQKVLKCRHIILRRRGSHQKETIEKSVRCFSRHMQILQFVLIDLN